MECIQPSPARENRITALTSSAGAQTRTDSSIGSSATPGAKSGAKKATSKSKEESICAASSLATWSMLWLDPGRSPALLNDISKIKQWDPSRRITAAVFAWTSWSATHRAVSKDRQRCKALSDGDKPWLSTLLAFTMVTNTFLVAVSCWFEIQYSANKNCLRSLFFIS